jgi:adenosylmethionine-8-amino-7-oxononanoate aminotransferase
MTEPTKANWAAADATHVWHPFTQVGYAPENIIIEHGDGACFVDLDGNRFIDGIASWWVNLHGHCNPFIIAAIGAQLQQLEHSIFAGFTHKPGIELAQRLLTHLPGFDKVFFSDNGSTSVEVALKMCFQYWANKGTPKHKVIAFKEAYHGDTFGGMSVAARNAFNAPFAPLLFDVIPIELPTAGNITALLATVEEVLKNEDVACFIFEPLVLGAAGMLMYSPEHLQLLINLCRQYNCLTIADEVMTGFGRTGKFFAIDYLQEQPDIICLSKGITGGFFPLGATACRQFIFDAFISADKMKTFFHGHSYTGNPVTCAAALASLTLTESGAATAQIQFIAASHAAFAAELSQYSAIAHVRHTGTILAFDIKTKEATGYLNSSAEPLAEFFIKRGIILRPLGNVLYVLPPYCITAAELNQVYTAIRELMNTMSNVVR